MKKESRIEYQLRHLNDRVNPEGYKNDDGTLYRPLSFHTSTTDGIVTYILRTDYVSNDGSIGNRLVLGPKTEQEMLETLTEFNELSLTIKELFEEEVSNYTIEQKEATELLSKLNGSLDRKKVYYWIGCGTDNPEKPDYVLVRFFEPKPYPNDHVYKSETMVSTNSWKSMRDILKAMLQIIPDSYFSPSQSST